MTNNGETVDPKQRSSANVETDFSSAILQATTASQLLGSPAL